MYGDDPSILARRSTTRRRLRSDRIRSMLDELEQLGAMASAALPATPRSGGWSDLRTTAGVTDAQSEFIDYWSPQLVLRECQTRRELILVLDEWARAEPVPANERQLNHILDQLTAPLTGGGSASVEPFPQARPVGMIPGAGRGLAH